MLGPLVRASGRSWWQAKYHDGKVLNEWDTLSLISSRLTPAIGRTSRWEDVPKKGLVALGLYCPNGQLGLIETPKMEPLVQLKSGGFMANGGGHYTDAQIIGAIENLETGAARFYAWEIATRRLVHFADNVFNMRYMNIGRLSLAVQGIAA